jgi:hypothetical protein
VVAVRESVELAGEKALKQFAVLHAISSLRSRSGVVNLLESERSRSMSTLAQKLGIRPGSRVAADGRPLAEVLELLDALPEGVAVSPRTGQRVDQVLLVANGLADLAPMLDGVWNEVASGGRLWVWYRKGANKSRAKGSEVPLHRDTLQALLAEHGMDGVTLISVNDTWSSMRVREL